MPELHPHIITFGQIPLNNEMGLLEFVDNAETLRSFERKRNAWEILETFLDSNLDLLLLSVIGGN
jgi:hypothetical protein